MPGRDDANDPAVPGRSTPIRGRLPTCCARAAIGNASAFRTRAINSRRFTPSPPQSGKPAPSPKPCKREQAISFCQRPELCLCTATQWSGEGQQRSWRPPLAHVSSPSNFGRNRCTAGGGCYLPGLIVTGGRGRVTRPRGHLRAIRAPHAANAPPLTHVPGPGRRMPLAAAHTVSPGTRSLPWFH